MDGRKATEDQLITREERQVLSDAAVIGEHFDFGYVREVKQKMSQRSCGH